jgi:hypothetical protein
MSKHPGLDLVERARALAPLIAREADEIERTRRLTSAVTQGLIENGLVDEAADGALRLHAQARVWERHVERLLPADAVIAIRRVAKQES